MTGGGFGIGYLAGMFGVVASGAVIPVVPTGAAVSVAAALSVSDADAYRIQQQLNESELRTLLLSRLVPGGRVPVLLAAATGGYSFRRFVVADIAATLLRAIVYRVLGLVGGSIFPEPWQGVPAAIVLVILASSITPTWQRLSGRRAADVDG